jgi:hypothetical protein
MDRSMRVYGLDSSGSGYGSIHSYEHGNELSGCMKGGEIFGNLSDCQLLKMNSGSWC